MRSLTEYTEDQQSRKRLLYLIAFPAVLILLLGVYGGYRFIRSRSSSGTTAIGGGEVASASTGKLTATEQQQLVAEVRSVMVLPDDEEPAIALVSDVERLQDQVFFKNAHNGDIVLVYNGAKKAILYRPSTKKVVETAPIDFNEEEVAGASTAQPTPEAEPTEADSSPTPTPTPKPLTVVVRNGTSVSGGARRYSDAVEDALSYASVTQATNAQDQDHDTTIIVVVNESREADIQKLAKALGITVGALPSGESEPSADALVILGSDKAE